MTSHPVSVSKIDHFRRGAGVSSVCSPQETPSDAFQQVPDTSHRGSLMKHGIYEGGGGQTKGRGSPEGQARRGPRRPLLP